MLKSTNDQGNPGSQNEELFPPLISFSSLYLPPITRLLIVTTSGIELITMRVGGGGGGQRGGETIMSGNKLWGESTINNKHGKCQYLYFLVSPLVFFSRKDEI